MNEAPDRVWVEVDRSRGGTSPRIGTAWDYKDNPEDDVEYIRADLLPVEQLQRMHREMIEQGVKGWPNTIADILTALGKQPG